MVGVEAGTQAMMDWMRKDVRVDQVIEAAERCARSGVGAIFNFIVGFPGENDASVRATLALAKRLRRLSRNFEIALFGYRPYPGSEIARDVAGTGYGLPGTIEEWASFDFVGSPSPWLRASLQREIEAFRFYQRVGWGRRSVWRAPLQAVARWRCDHDRYEWPVEKRLIEWWRPPPQLS